jgi:hypothetical protein
MKTIRQNLHKEAQREERAKIKHQERENARKARALRDAAAITALRRIAEDGGAHGGAWCAAIAAEIVGT